MSASASWLRMMVLLTGVRTKKKTAKSAHEQRQAGGIVHPAHAPALARGGPATRSKAQRRKAKPPRCTTPK